MANDPYVSIAISEIGVDGDVSTETFLKYRQNQEMLKQVSEGTNDREIPGQAIEAQSAGSGRGITIDRMNREEDSGTVVFTGAVDPQVIIVTTTLPQSLTNAIFTAVVFVSGENVGEVKIEPVSRPWISSNAAVKITRTGGSTSSTWDWKAWAVAE